MDGDARAGPPPPAAGRGAPPARPLADAAARPRRRHRGRAAGAARRARHPLDPGTAHRRHHRHRARPPAGEAADRPRHHPREPVAPPLPSGRPPSVRRASPRGGGRVARAAGEQARRPDRARPRPPARLPAGFAHLGALGHPRQSRGRPRGPPGRGPRWEPIRPAGARRGGQGGRRRLADPGDDRALPLGRAPRPQAPAAGDRGDRGGADRPRLHQHPLADRDLVPGDPRGPPRLGRGDRPPPRLARPQGARLRGGGPLRRRACAASSPPPASTSASTSPRWTGCSRWGAPRGSPASRSGPAAAATSRAR